MLEKFIRRTAGLALAVLTFVSFASMAQNRDSFRLIAHPGISADWVDKSTASDYFLKKKSRWSQGIEVKPVDLSINQIRESFSRKIHNRSRSAIKKYWQRQIFTGDSTPPPEKHSERDVIAYVSSTPGAIGYVSANANLNGASVKVLRIN